jgi:hypothetical protein
MEFAASAIGTTGEFRQRCRSIAACRPVGRLFAAFLRAHRRRAAARLPLDLRVGIQVCAAVDNLDGTKASRSEAALVFLDADRASNTSDVGHQIVAHFRRQWFPECYIAYRQPPTRFQHARNLAKHCELIGGKVDNAIADNAINRIIRQAACRLLIRETRRSIAPPSRHSYVQARAFQASCRFQ